MKNIALIIVVFLALSCKNQQDKKEKMIEVKQETKQDVKKHLVYDFELQGHRGARGMAPENTIPAFKMALNLGVNTLELDVVITKDKQVLVSHEPWLNYKITLDALGNRISKEEATNFNIYKHTYTEVSKFDVGSVVNPLFPNQKSQKVSKPLLSQVISSAEIMNSAILYNIEIKSTPEDEAKEFQPSVKEFSDLVLNLIKEKLPLKRVVIQSFDIRVLKYIHKTYPEFTLAYLVAVDGFKTNIDKLGFVPEIYSPYFILLNAEEVNEIHKSNVRVIPWTVNSIVDMKKLLLTGVDGLITDYPKLALTLRN